MLKIGGLAARHPRGTRAHEVVREQLRCRANAARRARVACGLGLNPNLRDAARASIRRFRNKLEDFTRNSDSDRIGNP